MSNREKDTFQATMTFYQNLNFPCNFDIGTKLCHNFLLVDFMLFTKRNVKQFNVLCLYVLYCSVSVVERLVIGVKSGILRFSSSFTTNSTGLINLVSAWVVRASSHSGCWQNIQQKRHCVRYFIE